MPLQDFSWNELNEIEKSVKNKFVKHTSILHLQIKFIIIINTKT